MGKGLLISDIQLLPNLEDLDFCDVSSWNLIEILVYLKEIEVDYIVIYAELNYANVPRSDFNGIELLKHIRLTPELGDINKKPILLLHWLNIVNYIDREKENIFLFSPGIILKRLPINDLMSFNFEPIGNDFTFNEYLFNSAKDEQISEHNFRNQIAIAEFNKQSIEAKIIVLDKPIWFKKLFYRNIDASQTFRNIKTQLPNELSLLLIDDMAVEWKIAILKVIPNAKIEVCTSKEQAIQTIQIIKSKVKLSEDEFTNSVKELVNVSNEIEKGKEEKNQISSSSESNLVSIISTKNKINLNTKTLNEVSKEFKEFLKDFISGQLADMLISSESEIEAKIADIDSKARKDAETLKDLITKIIKAKSDLIEENKRLINFESKKLVYDPKLNNIHLVLKKLYEKQKELIPKTSFENLAQKKFDLILLDMHLTKESEGNQIDKMDGYEILNLLQNLNITIPTAIFSATTRKQDELYNRFSSFLYKHNYIKGITPVDRFIALIEDLDKVSYINYLIELINKITIFPTFLKREYDYVDSDNYNLLVIPNNDKMKINFEFTQITKKLNHLRVENSIEILKEIIHTLSKIQKTYRLVLNNTKHGDSLFWHQNLKKNNIENKCSKLNHHRKCIEHPENLTPQEMEDYENWLKILDLKEINRHLKTVYEGLIFNK